MRPLGMHVGAMMEKLVRCHGNTEHSGMNWLAFSSLCIDSVLCLQDTRHCVQHPNSQTSQKLMSEHLTLHLAFQWSFVVQLVYSLFPVFIQQQSKNHLKMTNFTNGFIQFQVQLSWNCISRCSRSQIAADAESSHHDTLVSEIPFNSKIHPSSQFRSHCCSTT